MIGGKHHLKPITETKSDQALAVQNRGGGQGVEGNCHYCGNIGIRKVIAERRNVRTPTEVVAKEVADYKAMASGVAAQVEDVADTFTMEETNKGLVSDVIKPHIPQRDPMTVLSIGVTMAPR